MSFNSQSLVTEFMTEEQIRKVCPLAYADAPTSKVSDKYVMANTSTVISDMEKLGWKVVAAKQRKGNAKSSGRFSFHMVAFQNPDVKITKTVVNPDSTKNEEVDCWPRIILTNSHDGLSCFRFMVGLFRLVCSNGLCIASDMFADMKIRHINYTFEELQKLITSTIEALPGQIDILNDMQKVILTEEQKKSFALSALKIRKGLKPEDELMVDDETVQDMMTPVRDEDKEDDLWTVFNVIQEKCIKGGFSAKVGDKKAKKVRAVKGFIRDLDINQKLWKLAESFLPKKDQA